MDPLGPIAQRFPLVPRPRPACSPLAARVEEITRLADAAARDSNPTTASAVFNRAALLASDCGLPDLARTWCHQHADLYLTRTPLTGRHARSALEPLVNLARLHIRDGRGDDAHRLLTDLYHAVTTQTRITVDGLPVPAALTTTEGEHAEIVQWLWSVLLADAPRALITAGRWHDAHTHLQEHHGIGRRLLDGLQTAVLAALIDGDQTTARTHLAAGDPQEPWEHTVAACLACLCHGADEHRAAQLTTAYAAWEPAADQAVFHTRLTLTVIDLLTPITPTTARELADTLIEQVHRWTDGYAARDVLAHSGCRGFLTGGTDRRLRQVVDDAGLGFGELPDPLYRELETALAGGREVICRALHG